MATATGSPAAPLSRVPVLNLVQQIGQIIAQGEDSGTPSQHTEVRARLRSVLLQLLDVGVSSPSAGSRELGAVIQLLKLTLQKVPNWLTGDTNTLLLEILERFLPRLTHPMESKTAADLVDAVTLILNRIESTEPEQFYVLLKHLCELFEDVYVVSLQLSTDGRCKAVVKCSINSLGSADSMQRPISVELDTIVACDRVLQTLLKIFAEIVTSKPNSLVSKLPATLLLGASCLVGSPSVLLQAAALQFASAVIRSSPILPAELHHVPDRLLFVLHSFSSHRTVCSPEAKVIWYRQFTSMLQALMDCAGTTPERPELREQLLHVVACACVAADLGSVPQDVFVRAFAEAIAKDPAALQRHAHVLTAILPVCSTSSRHALLAATRAHLDIVSSEMAMHAMERVAAVTFSNFASVIDTASGSAVEERGSGGGSKRRRVAQNAEPERKSLEDDSFGRISVVVTALFQVVNVLQYTIAQGGDQSIAAMHALADTLQAVSPLAPRAGSHIAASMLVSLPVWKRIISEEQCPGQDWMIPVTKMFSVFLESILRDKEGQSRADGRDSQSKEVSSVLISTRSFFLSIAQSNNTNADAYGLAAATVACQLDLVDCGGLVMELFGRCGENSSSRAPSVVAAKAMLVPVIACIASAKGSSLPEAARSDRRQKHSQPSSSTNENPAKSMLQEAAVSKDPAVRNAFIRGLLLVVDWSHDPPALALRALRAVAESSGSISPAIREPPPDSRPSLTSATCDWLHPSLDELCLGADRLPSSPELVVLVREFLQFASLSHIEHGRSLARWLLAQTTSLPEVRAATIQECDIFASSRFLLAAYHEGPHPVHSRDRHTAAETCEKAAIQEARARLASEKSTDPDVMEDLLQLTARVGCSMRSPNSQISTLAMLVQGLEHRDPAVAAVAAQCLRGAASARNSSVRELFFSTPLLLETICRILPKLPDQELASLLGMNRRNLAVAVTPKILPALFQKNDRAAIDALANAAGLTPQRMMLDHGHYPYCASIIHEMPPLEQFMSMVEEVSGQEFFSLARAILPRIVTEMVIQTGMAPSWSTEGSVPDAAINRIANLMSSLATETREAGADASPSSSRTLSTAEFLAEGDHVTRMLKEFGDSLYGRLVAVQSSTPAAADVAAAVGVLRNVLVLVRLTGAYVGRFLPQFMVLFGAAVRHANHKDVRLQGLSGWLQLVKALEAEAPLQLGGVVSQVVVTLMDSLQESGAVGASAARVVEELISACRKHYPHKLRSMPPLPQWPGELRHVNTLLAEERGTLSMSDHVTLLLESLGNESLSVRSTALQELRSLLAVRRDMLLSLQSSNPDLFKQLVGTLLKTSEPEAINAASVAVQQTCAECLGMLGAIDPARIHLEPQPPHRMCSTVAQLAIEILIKHLVRLLKTAPTMQSLDLTTLAIQDVLRCQVGLPAPTTDVQPNAAAVPGTGKSKRSPATIQKQQRKGKAIARPTTPQPESNALFAALPDEVQAIVRPYLESKYSIRTGGKKTKGIVFASDMSLRRWLAVWLTQITEQHATGVLLSLFRAANPVVRFDIPTALFLAPYMVHNAVTYGGAEAAADIAAEVKAVLAAEATSRDGVLCMQAVFTLLDVLKRWCEEAKAGSKSSVITSGSAAGPAGTTTTSTTTSSAVVLGDASEWEGIRAMLLTIPRDALAKAAAKCGAHARALLQFEEYVREVRGGGANPVAAYSPVFDDAEVTFLLEVYSRLEEPDGLDGLVKLRQEGPKPEDQRLAAEKMGAWGEALALYERDFARGQDALLSSVAGVLGVNNTTTTTNDDDGGGALDPIRRGYLNCLLQMGQWQGLLTVVEGMAVQMGTRGSTRGTTTTTTSQLAAMGTAAAWRLGRWDQLSAYLAASEAGFATLDADLRWEVRIARLLRTMASNSQAHRTSDHGGGKGGIETLRTELDAARAEVMGPFSAAAMESYSRAYPHLVKLHMLQEVADTAACMERNAGEKERRRALRWDERLSTTQDSLTTQAPILALRRQLASIAGWASDAGQCWLQHAKLCRITGHFDAAVPAVLEASSSGVPQSSLERVELLYARGDAHRALSELRSLETQLAHGGGDGMGLRLESDRSRYRAKVLLRLAEWTAETGQGTREEVTGLFDRALAVREGWETGIFLYAAYLDQLMQDAKARQEVQGGGLPRGADRLDGKSRIKLGEDKPYLSFLPEVLRGYGRSVEVGHAHIYRSLPRLLTLWFEFGATVGQGKESSVAAAAEVEGAVMELMRGFSKSVPMHCWLIALPQLISRICHRNTEVATLTRYLVTQITMAYPQQALWALAAVSKSTVPQRRSAANGILSSAKRAAHSEDARRIFVENNTFCEQLIKLCSLVPGPNKRIMHAKDLGHLTRIMPLDVMMPVHSALTPVLPSTTIARGGGGGGARGGPADAAALGGGWRPFGDVVTIHGIEDEIEVMASLQKPKRIVLIGSDGLQYPFLAKPKDDLRKDNRMMEVASVVNRLFREEPGARRRNLHLRRFAVLPITEDCGLIEWVQRTRHMRGCISNMLTEGGIDIRAMNSKVKTLYDKSMKGVTSRGATTAALLRWFEATLRDYPPCFHKWFLQTFPEPAAWLNSRLAYTRTYAAWCVVGHVVGLGDRHGENVLIDMSSGDAIQIDFGCLFDKGVTLAQPEVVPFRLTQNVVDAFGVAGIEGAFRKSFEATLGVLRAHRDIILSIMDTFVHDPLVDWAKSRARDGGAESENPQARDWLATMDGRLRGTLLGVSSRPCMPLSVEGHTHRLIQEAGNKENLSKMYIWWQAWY